MTALLHTSILGLPPARVGKVREVIELGEEVLIVATDRISAFDCVMANGIPGKGRVLTQMSAFWFERLADVCPSHLISVDDAVIAERIGQDLHKLRGRTTLAKRAEPLPIECVGRGYLDGSLLKEYRENGGRVHGLDLPDGLQQGDRLPEPIFTPATKAQSGHDENISVAMAADQVGTETVAKLSEITLSLYRLAASRAEEVGLILADTKFEFGRLADGSLIWIDEALTPDSSRFWEMEAWRPGGPQQSFDKQFVRDFLEESAWDKNPPGPELPEDVVKKTGDKYREAYRRIVGEEIA